MKLAGVKLQPPADMAKVELLRQKMPSGIPEDYFGFLARSDGADVWFDDVDFAKGEIDYIRIDSCDSMLSENLSVFKELRPDMLVIGSDAGSNLIGYDTKKPQPWPIVMFDAYADDLHLDECLLVASSMSELHSRYFQSPA